MPIITHVSDTAHWVAMYRAFESERPDPLFDDPYARRMAGDLGRSIVREPPHGESLAWTVIVRTVVMDEMILDCVAKGATGVLNLGAGLDTRAFRLDLPPKLRWFDVDLPAMVAYRESCLDGLRPRCKHAHVAADVNDGDALKRVIGLARRGAGPLLVVSEGLLVYLAPAQVSALAAALHAERSVRWWLADLVSPTLLNLVSARWPSDPAAASACFRFAPGDSAGFFDKLGWQEASFRSTFDEAIRLHRSPPGFEWWAACVAPFWPGSRQNLRRMWGVALMEADCRGPSSAASARRPSSAVQH